MDDKDFGFDFYISGNDNNEEADNFEDIYSSSSEAEDMVSLSSFSDEAKGRHTKKKHKKKSAFGIWWKNRRGWQKALIITPLSLLLVLIIAISTLFILFDYNYVKITSDPEELGIESVIDENIINIALFGIDTRTLNSFKGNADSIMILSLNTVTKQVKIISVIRDTFVPITYNGKTTYNKINSAYAKGGPVLAMKVLNTVFGLDIMEYATVNFYGMTDIIDAVGGIEAELTAAEVASASKNAYAINACIKELCSALGKNPKDYYINKSGKQHLNGIQAVSYSRIRHVANIWGTNNDYGRTDRQRYVMEQLFNKAVKLKKSKYVDLVRSLIPCSETSLSYSEIIDLAVNILLDSPSFHQDRIPREDFLMPRPQTNAGWVAYYDLGFAEKLIHAFIYDDITFDEYIEKNGIEKNDWYGGIRVPSNNKKPSNSTGSSNTSSNNSTVSEPSEDTSSVPKEEDPVSSDDGTSEEPPIEGDDSGESQPDEGETPPDEGETPPDSGETPPDSGESTPSEEKPTTSEPPQSSDTGSEETVTRTRKSK